MWTTTMKRRDAIKRAAAGLLGFLVAPFVAKAAEPSWDDKMAAAVDAHDWRPPVDPYLPGDVMLWKPKHILEPPPVGWALADGKDNAKSRGGSGWDLVIEGEGWPYERSMIIERLRDKP